MAGSPRHYHDVRDTPHGYALAAGLIVLVALIVLVWAIVAPS